MTLTTEWKLLIKLSHTVKIAFHGLFFNNFVAAYVKDDMIILLSNELSI